MTVKQFIKEHGWIIDCDTSIPYRYMNVNISFIDSHGETDETQFSIRAYDLEELTNLYNDFCKNENFPKNTVNCITVIEVAEIQHLLS